MGLIEDSIYEQGKLVSTLYINSAGIKDVGSYSCSQVRTDVIDIDDGIVSSVYLFVISKLATILDPLKVVLITPSEPLLLPCTPSHTSVSVTVTANGADVTDQFSYDPRIGFTAKKTSLSLSSFTCYFKYKSFTQSVHLKNILSTRVESSEEMEHLSVTIQKSSEEDDSDNIEIVCKVNAVNGTDIFWMAPSLESNEIHKDDLVLFEKFNVAELMIEGVIVSTLTVSNTTPEDQGVYR